MILMNHAMMGAAGYQAAGGGSGHPNLYWAFPFWLQTGREEVVSGQVMAAGVGSPTQQAGGMYFDGTDTLFCPGPVPVGPKTIIAKLYSLSTVSNIFHGILDNKYVNDWGTERGHTLTLYRGDVDNALRHRAGSCEFDGLNFSSSVTTASIATSFGIDSTLFLDGSSVVASAMGCSELESLQVARIGVYHDASSFRFLTGGVEFLYLFDTEMTPAEISAVFADPESVLP